VREDYSMPNSSENDDTAGWVMGDLPGDEGRPDEDARLNAEALEASATNDDNQPPDEPLPPEVEAAPERAEDAADLGRTPEPPEVTPDPANLEPEAAVEAVLEAAVVDVPPIFLGEVPLPIDESEPEAVPVLVEAELQADALAAQAEAEIVPAVDEIDSPVTSEGETLVDEVVPVADVTLEPANGVERPEETEAAGKTEVAEKPRKRGKKARDPKPAASAADAAEALSLAGSAGSGPAVTMGPLVATGDLSVVALVESLLFVADGAVPVGRLAEAMEIHPREVEAALAELAESYQHRGLSLQRFRDRVQLTTSPAAAALVERFLGLAASTPLSRAALEALAIVAYQQPVTRPQIEAVRGVNSDSVIKNLLTKGLIEESGRAEGPGRPVLYSTTTEFMQHFGLASLTDLPPLTLLSAEPAAETPTAESILKG
jgi:segregation and condensation protein B